MRRLFCLVLVGVVACSSSEDERPPHGGWSAIGGAPAPAASGGAPQAGESAVLGGQGGLDATGGEAGSSPEPAGAAGLAGAGGFAGEGGMGGEPGDPKPLSGDCLADPLHAPSSGQCVTVGEPPYACNPVTGLPCATMNGETCEFDGSGFSCQTLPTERIVPCRRCDAALTASCVVGFTCLGTLERCTRYCCDDGDCGVGASCVRQPPTVVGICQAKSDRRLQNFGWNLPPADAGSDAEVDAADAAPPIDCPSCSAQYCADREQACANDGGCTLCVSTDPPGDECYGLLSWQMLTSCRCSNCSDLCVGSCL